LEAGVVILAEPERAHAATQNELMYVALTRAKHHVIVLGSLPAPRAVP
jgi:ATP-dependent exoDNAse (exonuclease V) beta subunit